MTKQEADKLIQDIYDGIFNSLTKAEPGGQAIMPANSTVLTLMKPGMIINPSDFRNPWSPGNRNGSEDAAVNTAQLVDAIPEVSGIYAENGNFISQVYEQILDGINIPAQRPDPATEQQLQKAHSYLYRTVEEIDPDTGEVTAKEIESVVYRKYLDNQAAYHAVRLAYVAAYQAAQSDKIQKGMWPLIAPTLQIPVRSAYDKWRSNFADKVEQNLAIMETSSQNALQKAFKRAKDLFKGYGVALNDTGSGNSPMTQRTTLLPSNWYRSDNNAHWITKVIKQRSTETNSSSEYRKIGGSAGFSLGIFSIGGSGGHTKESHHFSRETNNLEIEYQYTLVTIRRPWLTFNLLGTKNWNLGNLYRKGEISTGTKQGQADSVWPLLPTSFVAVKGIKITADWAKADWEKLKKTVKAGGKVGIGPFSIGGSYGKSSRTMKSTFDETQGAILVPGVQIMGFINQVVPNCPPLNAPTV